MTGVITWVIDGGDGECIERGQPSTALQPMPAYGALNASLTAASQPIDGITNDYVTGDGSDQLQLNPGTKEVGTWTVEGNLCKEFEPDAVTKGGQEGEEMVADSWSPTPACVIGETCTPTCPTGLTGETLVQPFKGTSAAFDSIGSSVGFLSASIPNAFAPSTLPGLGQGNVFAPVSGTSNFYDETNPSPDYM